MKHSFSTRRVIVVALLCLFTFTTVFFVACQPQQSTQWDQAQQESKNNQPAASKQAVAGNQFNAFFPKGEGGFDLTYAQEKVGFAQAKLKKGGKDVAELSVFDTISNPDAAQKYQGSNSQIAGFPSVDIGENGTSVLVANRFQVQIRSSDASFGKAEREQWLQKFNLDGLSQLQS